MSAVKRLLRARRPRPARSSTLVPAASVSQLQRPGVAQQGDVGMLQRGPDGDHLGVAFGVHEAGKAVAGLAADAPAVGHVGLVQHHRRRRVERAGSRRP